MKAIWNDTVIAQANEEDLIRIEGNWYFPPTAINKEFFTANSQHTTCFWKGEASYYDITVNGNTNDGAAWYYPKQLDGAIGQVKKDFTNYVAFWRGIAVVD